MRVPDFLDSDLRFWYAIGGFLILVYVLALTLAAHLNVTTIDRRVLPLTVGFFLFMFVYFVSVSVLRLEPDRS